MTLTSEDFAVIRAIIREEIKSEPKQTGWLPFSLTVQQLAAITRFSEDTILAHRKANRHGMRKLCDGPPYRFKPEVLECYKISREQALEALRLANLLPSPQPSAA